MKKGNLKVMVSSKGSRIMEELGDTVKVYSADEWKKETERREKEGRKKGERREEAEEKPKLNGKVKKGK